MIDRYRTIAEPTSARITRKKSRFFASVFPVTTADEIEEELARLRRSHHDAAHVCYAYRLRGENEPVSVFEDAGEPARSAGLPICQQLEKDDLLDVLAVVVRHFGGVKLGIGGLIRAYSDAVRAALDRGSIVERILETEIEVAFSPDLTSAVMGTIHRQGARVVRIEYDAEARAVVALPPSRVDTFRETMRDATGARARMEVRP